MADADLRRALRRIQPPDAIGAERRAWAVVRTAFEEREPARRRSPASGRSSRGGRGRAHRSGRQPAGLLNAVRDAVGRTKEKKVAHTRGALPLPGIRPAAGRTRRAARGSSAQTADRLLGRYRDASWSPEGFSSRPLPTTRRRPGAERDRSLVAGARRKALLPALVAEVGLPKSRTCAVNAAPGRGRRDAGPARRRGSGSHGAGLEARRLHARLRRGAGRIRVVDTATDKLSSFRSRLPPVTELAWSDDGTRLLALTHRSLIVFGGLRGQRIGRASLPADAVAAAFAPGVTASRSSCSSRSRAPSSSATATHPARRHAWSSTRRALRNARLVAERHVAARRLEERRCVHVRDAGRGGSRIVGDIARQLGAFPDVPQAGWCCPTG